LSESGKSWSPVPGHAAALSPREFQHLANPVDDELLAFLREAARVGETEAPPVQILGHGAANALAACVELPL